jgi:hypothetical protein
LKRAIDIIRNREGLRSAGQLPVLNTLIEGYAFNGLFEDADREHANAYNIAELAWGARDQRLVNQLVAYAQLKEATGRFTAARLLYTRAVELIDAVEPGSVRAIAALRGMARNFRLAALHGETREAALEVPAVLSTNAAVWAQIPASEAERALTNALQRLDRAGEPAAATRGAILVDLGDWHLSARSGARAMSTWRDAWKQLAAAGDTSLLATPAPVTYRAPQIAVSRRMEDPQLHVVREIQVRMSFDAQGNVLDASIANPDPEHEAAERAVITAARRASWRPAFQNGEPVPAGEYLLREPVYVKLPPATN